MSKLKSASEKLARKLEDSSEGSNVDITIVVDADAAAVEEALDQEEISSEAAESEEIVELNEVVEEQAAEMRAIARVLREHGLNEGMRALLVASGTCAMHGIYLPGRESLEASGRNMAKAESVAAALEAKESTFWESTQEFFRDMWDRVIRVYHWVTTKIGTMRARCERARNSLKGKTIDTEKAKDHKTDDIATLATPINAQCTMVDSLKSLITGNFLTVEAGNVLGNPTALAPVIDAKNLLEATGYSYDKDDNSKLGEVDKDFLKTTDSKVAASSLSEYESTRWELINRLLLAMADIKELESLAKTTKSKMENMRSNHKAFNKGAGTTDETSKEKETATILRTRMGFLLKISGKFTSAMTQVCKLYIKNCAVVRASCKTGD